MEKLSNYMVSAMHNEVKISHYQASQFEYTPVDQLDEFDHIDEFYEIDEPDQYITPEQPSEKVNAERLKKICDPDRLIKYHELKCDDITADQYSLAIEALHGHLSSDVISYLINSKIDIDIKSILKIRLNESRAKQEMYDAITTNMLAKRCECDMFIVRLKASNIEIDIVQISDFKQRLNEIIKNKNENKLRKLIDDIFIIQQILSFINLAISKKLKYIVEKSRKSISNINILDTLDLLSTYHTLSDKQQQELIIRICSIQCETFVKFANDIYDSFIEEKKTSAINKLKDNIAISYSREIDRLFQSQHDIFSNIKIHASIAISRTNTDCIFKIIDAHYAIDKITKYFTILDTDPTSPENIQQYTKYNDAEFMQMVEFVIMESELPKKSSL